MPSNTTYNPYNNEQFDKNKLHVNGQGVTTTISHGTTGNIDFTITDDVLLTEGFLLVKNANWGDSVNLKILQPDGNGGWIVLLQTLTNWYINPDATQQTGLSSNYPAKIPAGLTLRVEYTSTSSTTDVQVSVNVKFHTVLV